MILFLGWKKGHILSMAKIIEISVNYGLTRNLGNYESLRVDVTLSAKIADDEDHDKVWSELIEDARNKAVEAAETERELLQNW